ncbi:MAG: DUF2067 domain-containing protein, partial [Desulfurococcales archaeon]|nr:DUF2067 domain-containing protein [Desulfurococcales archaeon]
MSRPGLKKNVIHIKIPRELSIEKSELINKVLDNVKAVFTSIKIENNTLRIEFYSHDYMRKEIIASIRNTVSQYIKEAKENLSFYSVNDITDMAKRTIQLDPLIVLLRFHGYNASRTRNGVETDAPRDIIEETSRRLGLIYNSLENEISCNNFSRSLKSLLAIIIYNYPDKNLCDIVRELENKGLVYMSGGKRRLKGDWKRILCKLYLIP